MDDQQVLIDMGLEGGVLRVRFMVGDASLSRNALRVAVNASGGHKRSRRSEKRDEEEGDGGLLTVGEDGSEFMLAGGKERIGRAHV